MAKLISSCTSCSYHDPKVLIMSNAAFTITTINIITVVKVLILPDTATQHLLDALEALYLRGIAEDLAQILGLETEQANSKELSTEKETTNNTAVARDLFDQVLETNYSESGPDFSCTQCGKVFPFDKTARIKYHKCGQRKDGSQNDTSEGQDKAEGKFSCEETARCRRAFITESGLQKHILKMHHSERKYGCDICPKRFHKNKKLMQHKQVHEKKAIVCGICGERKRTMYVLEQHHKQIHTTEAVICHRCDKKFENRRDLRIHLKSCARNSRRAALKLKVEDTPKPKLLENLDIKKPV